MSDGGAGALVEGVTILSKFKVGRVALWLIAAWLTLTGITGHSGGGRGSGLVFFIALLCAAAALFGGFLAYRQKRAERASLRMTFAVLGMVVAGIVGAALLIGRKKTATVTPPSETEVNALAEEQARA